LICPPTFLDHVVVVGRPVAQLRPDGLFRNPESVGVGMRRVMFGGQQWEWLAPVHVGDTVTAIQRLAAIEEKEGGKGPFALVTWETTYTNQDEEVVARARLQGISR
jgi:acyl dehydratase